MRKIQHKSKEVLQFSRANRHRQIHLGSERSCFQSLATPPVIGDKVPVRMSRGDTRLRNHIKALEDIIGDFWSSSHLLICEGRKHFIVECYFDLIDPPTKYTWWELEDAGYPAIYPHDLSGYIDYPAELLHRPEVLAENNGQQSFGFLNDIDDQLIDSRPRLPTFTLEPFLVPVWSPEAHEAELYEDGVFSEETTIQMEGKLGCPQSLNRLKEIIKEMRFIYNGDY